MLEPVPPHPVLTRYYPSADARTGAIGDLFDAGAPFYERICNIMSLGSGNRYRRDTLRDAGIAPGARLLDLATGPGLILRSGQELCGETGFAVGLDLSLQMLHECREHSDAPLLRATCTELPFAGESFDIISMGYALRHMADLRTFFGECLRVLKPGGRLLVLEITPPKSKVGRVLTKFYLRDLVPTIAQVTTGRTAARRMMTYFWDTIEACVPPEVILQTMTDAGFVQARRKVQGAILSEYLATKPA